MLGVVQMAAKESPWENLREISLLAKRAKSLGCEAVCFPECVLTGYAPERAAERGISGADAIISKTCELAKELQIDLLVGFVERSERGMYITHGLFRRDGSRDFYRKTHLGKKEALYFMAGDELPVLELSCGIKIGIQLCVETHFPEITQTLSLRGAEVIFAPYAAPGTGEDRVKIWKKYIPARSYDNRVYVACCNLTGGESFGGGYFSASPEGEILSSGYGEDAHIEVFAVDRERLKRYRTEDGPRHSYYPGCRRVELYQQISTDWRNGK